MRRVIVICLIVFCLFYRVRPASNVSERMSSPQETDDCPAAAAIKSAHTAADRERLESLLDGILLLQPCSAGNTFRVAALGGGFYHWYMETPRASEAAKQAALAWGSKRTREERQQAAVNVKMLGKAAERMREEDIRALLCDAGIELPEEMPDREGFVLFTEAVSRVLLAGIFKERGEIMNISR